MIGGIQVIARDATAAAPGGLPSGPTDDLPPALTGAYELPPGVIEAFRRDGHIKLPGVLRPDEIAAYRSRVNLVIEDCARQDPDAAVAGAGWLFVKNVWQRSEVTRRLVTSPRLARIAAELLGVDAVRLFRDQSYYKEPGGSCTPWHQDSRFIPLATDQVVAIWVPLTPVASDMAPMSYATGSHRRGDLDGSGADDAAMDEFERGLRAAGLPIASHGEFAPGDVGVHFASTLHGSRQNRSSRRREVIVIAYFPDGARVADTAPPGPDAPAMDAHVAAARRHNREMVLPGVAPGELAAGPWVPVVYRRGAPAVDDPPASR